MNSVLDDIRVMRRGNAVQRYHTVPTLHSETVGAHCAGVACMVLAVTRGACSKNLLVAALLHDMAEQETGDVPATAKWNHPVLKVALDAAEKRALRMLDLDASIPVLSPADAVLLKICDMLDLCFKSLEELRLGNRNFYPLLLRGVSYVQDLLTHEDLLSLTHTLNPVMDELNRELGRHSP